MAMQRGTLSSSESAKCVMCGARTASYQTYTEGGVMIKIALCDKGGHDCSEIAPDIKATAKLAVTAVETAIRRQG